jgi:hypothetical protein
LSDVAEEKMAQDAGVPEHRRWTGIRSSMVLGFRRPADAPSLIMDRRHHDVKTASVTCRFPLYVF